MNLTRAILLLITTLLLAACEDGDTGSTGSPGATGATGLSSLVRQTDLAAGNANCPSGGVQVNSGIDDNGDGMLSSDEVDETSYICQPNNERNFNRIATFPVCKQFDAACDDDTETVAEISTVSEDGLTIIYTDSPGNQLGFVDIADPENPVALGLLALPGEPTSVATAGRYVLAGANTSTDFITTSGSLEVVDVATQTIVQSIDLGGQPDSLAVSPDGRYAAVAIENERDEDLGDGEPPQLPAGFVVVIDMTGAPDAWTTTNVSLTGVPDLFPTDPEPEYIDINSENVAVVTMQENNHLALIDLASATVTNDFSAGSANITNIDVTEEDPALISLTESTGSIPREADGVSWITDQLFATADEGDLNGGTRGFTIYNTDGDIVYTSGNLLDHVAVALGHYPDDRSGNKGNEPENIEVGTYGNDRYLFVNSERSSLVFVFNVNDAANPTLTQVLPTALGPEGSLGIPSRNLLVVSSEEDDRGDKFRGGLNIYKLDVQEPQYPTLKSDIDAPIAWGALSGLAADTLVDGILYAVEDSFYQQNRIFEIDITQKPSMLRSATRVLDNNGVFAAIDAVDLADPGVVDDDPTRIEVFDEADLDALINDDGSVNIDPEGIAKASDGGFWIASEGSGTIGDAGRPINSLNFIFKTDASGVIEDVITLPAEMNAIQFRFGFEGIAEYDGAAYVTFQRPWGGEDNVRIGVYDVASESWSFLFYKLDAPESPAGGWVGLSDITSLGGGEFLVLERDNQGGPDARVKRLYRIDVTGLNNGDVVTKTLVDDLMDNLATPGGPIAEKIEGSAVTLSGNVWIVNDNDGVDDNSGETQLMNLGDIL